MTGKERQKAEGKDAVSPGEEEKEKGKGRHMGF